MKRGFGFTTGAAVLLTASLSAQAGTIFSQDFDGATKSSLESNGWTFATEGTEEFGSQSSDQFLRLGGDTTENPSVTRTLGSSVQSGSLFATLGSSTSYAGIHLRVMSGSTSLFDLQLQSRNKVMVNGATTDSYTDSNVDVATIGSGSDYANRLNAAFSWEVDADGTGGTFNYTLSQPDPDHTGSAVIDSGQVTGRSFAADGVPDRILLETTTHNANSRDVLLYQLDAQSQPVPEPATLGLLGIAGAGVMLRRRRS